ncbi:LytR/AlgR family response regulator transcription factor [Jejudonia soesokkakensis]|uniref:LytR/AlgR family response regulator transcription factor n=1 Tax=Jejudonia soesokkakensis TaxID=1323432 RepID=A0ABW2MR55_9FLAO
MSQKVYIVEDMAISRAALIEMLQDSGHEVSGSAAHADKAWIDIKEKKIDVVLLDIHLAGAYDGIWLAHKIRAERNLPIIFLTAYGDDETLKELAKTKPNGYLMKPYNAPTLLTTIGIAIRSFKQFEVSEKMKKIDEPAYFVKHQGKQIKIQLSKIMYFRSEGNYVDIYVKSKAYSVRSKLTDILSELASEDFIQVHRRFAVNKNYITQYSPTSLVVGKMDIPLSKTYRKKVLTLLT